MTSSAFPTELTSFLDEYVSKKGNLKRKDINQFEAAGGDLNELRDLYESGNAEFNLGDRAQDMLRNKTASMDNVPIDMIPESETTGMPSTQGFLDEFTSGRGKITKSDVRTFEQAGGDLAKLQAELQKGNYTREEALADPSMLNDRGTVKYGNEDTYIGGKGQKFLEKKLAALTGGDESSTENLFPGETTDYAPGVSAPGTEPPEEEEGLFPGETTDYAPGVTAPDAGVTTPDTTGGLPDVGTDDGNDGSNAGTPNVDPSSGFPFNPGRHDGEPFTDYQENIDQIKSENAEYIAGIKDGAAFDPDTSFTTEYVNGLIDSGVIAGGENYLTPQEKDEARLEGDLAIKDAFDPDVMEARETQYADSIAAIGEEVNKMSGVDGGWSQIAQDAYTFAGPPEDASDAVKEDWTDTRAQWITDSRPTWVKEAMAEQENNPPPPVEEEQGAAAELAALPSKPKGKNYTFDLYGSKQEVPMEAPDKFKKKPAFDGYKGYGGFQEFIKMATDTAAHAEGEHLGKAKLYNALKDAGLSEEEMFKGAQYAGITNLRTDSDSIPDDVAKIKHAVDNNYYQGTVTEGGGLKSEADLFAEYKELGGKGKLKNFQEKMGYESYDSENDAQKFADYLSKQLASQGIYMNDKSMRKFNKELRAIEEQYGGGKITKKDYQGMVTDGIPRSDINEWVADFKALGGRVGKGLLAKIDGKTAEEAKTDNQSAALMNGSAMQTANYFQDGYGMALKAPDNSVMSTEFIDTDNDGTDDRYQAGPGMPTFKGKFGIRDSRKAKQTLGLDNRKALKNYLKQLQAAGITFESPLLEKYKYLDD